MRPVPDPGIVVRLLRDDRPVGHGLLVADDLVITCAHVVNLAAGRAAREPGAPAQPVRLHHPVGGAAEAVVAHWLPADPWRPVDDVALLRLTAPLRSEALARLVGSLPEREEPLTFFAHPDEGGLRDGAVGAVVCSGIDVTGMVQLAPLPGAVLLPAQGCSGAPVFNALGDVVGMVAQVFCMTPPMALAVPVDRLFASCPGLPGRERHLVRRQTAGTVRVDRGLSGAAWCGRLDALARRPHLDVLFAERDRPPSGRLLVATWQPPLPAAGPGEDDLLAVTQAAEQLRLADTDDRVLVLPHPAAPELVAQAQKSRPRILLETEHTLGYGFNVWGAMHCQLTELAEADARHLYARYIAQRFVDDPRRPLRPALDSGTAGDRPAGDAPDGGPAVDLASVLLHRLAPLPPEARADRPRLVVVRGASGVGKTALLREVFRRLVHGDHPQGALLIELGGRPPGPLWVMLLDVLTRLGYDQVTVRRLRDLVNDGSLVVLVDGFDELQQNLAGDEDVEASLRQLLGDLGPGGRVVLTGRSEHLGDAPGVHDLLGQLSAPLAQTSIVTLQPFEPADVRAYLARDEARCGWILKRPDLLELIQIPRLASFLTTLDPGDQPMIDDSSQAAVYRSLIELWWRHEERRHENVVGHIAPEFTRADRERTCRRLALSRWRLGQALTRSSLEEAVRSTTGPTGPTELRQFQNAVREIATATLMRRVAGDRRAKTDHRDGDERYDFIHESFGHYLLAEEIADAVTDAAADHGAYLSALLAEGRLPDLTVVFLADLAPRGSVTRRRLADWARTRLPHWTADGAPASGAPDDVTARNAEALFRQLLDGGLPAGDLAGHDLRHGSYDWANGDGRDLSGTRWPDLDGTSFRGAVLREATFRGAVLRDVHFDGADLTGADFTGARLTRVTFTGATFTGSRWDRAGLLDCVGLPPGEPALHPAAVAGRRTDPLRVAADRGPVRALAVSASLDVVAVAADHEITLVDARTGEQLAVTGTDAPVRQILFTTGLRLAWRGADGGVTTWDPAAGQAPAPAGRLPVVDLAGTGPAGPDDLVGLTAAGDVHGLPSATVLWRGARTSAVPGDRVFAGPDGTLLVLGRPGRTAHLAAPGRRALELPGYGGHAVATAFSVAGTYLAIASGGDAPAVRVWSTATGQPVLVLDDLPVTALAFSPREDQLAVGGADEVQLWSLPPTRPASASASVAAVAASGLDRAAVVLAGGAELLAFTPDGALVTCQGRSVRRVGPDGSVTLLAPFDTAVRHVAGPTCSTSAPGAAGAACPVLVAADGTGTLWRWALDQTTTPTPLAGAPASPVRTLAAVPDAVLACHQDGRLRRWPLGDGAVEDLGPARNVTALAGIGPAGTGIVLGDRTGGVELRRPGRTALALGEGDTRHRDRIAAIAVSDDARWLATASWDGTVRVWDAADGRLLGLLTAPDLPTSHRGAVTCLAFGATGLLASGSRDGTVAVWRPRARRWRRIAERPLGAAPVLLAYSPDGQLLAVAGADRTLRLLDGRTALPIGKELQPPDDATPPRHLGPVLALGFAAETGGAHLWLHSAAADQAVRCWRLSRTGAAELDRVLVFPTEGGYAVLTPEGEIKDSAGPPEALWRSVHLCRLSADGLRWLPTGAPADTSGL